MRATICPPRATTRSPALHRAGRAGLVLALIAASGCKFSAGADEDSRRPAMMDAGASMPDSAHPDGGSPAACPELGHTGTCLGTELVFCDGDTELRIDCAEVGDGCEMVGERAECTQGGRAAGCGAIDAFGTCDGADLQYCASSYFTEYVETIPCAAYGQLCDPDGATDMGAICVPHGPCPEGLDELGACDSNRLRFCEDGELYEFDCGVDTCREVGGFHDCFVPGTFDGCGDETAAGRCDGDTAVSCQGGVVTREDCRALGLACTPTSGGASCEPGDCPVACPAGHSCAGGRCVPESPTREWTYMIYIVGDNNLSDAAWIDVNEMEQVGSSDDVALVSQVEFSEENWFSFRVPEAYRAHTYRFLVGRDDSPWDVSSLESAEDLGNVNMSDPAALSEFIRATAAAYPAEHYALVMWNHGMGWNGGFQDVGDSGEMTLDELRNGVRDSGIHMDLLEFDACLMAMHEVGLAFRGVADILVASEEIEPGGGDPYESILEPLLARPSMSASELATLIVDEYMAAYDSPYRPYSLTRSAIDLRRIDEFGRQLGELSGALGNELVGDRGSVRAALSDQSVVRYQIPQYADMETLFSALIARGGEVGEAAGPLLSMLDGSELIVAARGSGSHARSGGLSIFLPAVHSFWGGVPSVQDYRQLVSPYPLEPWGVFLANLAAGDDSQGPAGGERFAAILTWADDLAAAGSEIDLDLHVYEPGGGLASPALGSVSANGLLSSDSADSHWPVESYQLAESHAPGAYIIIAHYYGGPDGLETHPQLTIIKDDIAGGYRTLKRGRIEDRELVLVPMSGAMPLEGVIDSENLEAVEHLDYSNVWYAAVLEVE